ncbi:DUF4062 domain-containing protein [Verrucomicrobium spinosum]|uniref:DUF4062 domain-containing protein n=1 Tax=Verrucomicrobium spinosum TaxID=2736 RepID=UPI00094682D6|nr:DUF4062 domain-containing protein [Verrucomicrobium spinosum]
MKPVIFISAVSKELAPSRQLVANTLLLLGYEPCGRTSLARRPGTSKKVLRNKINRSRGVIQLVGNAYGFEPKTPDPEFGPVSYTQYEALYARKRGSRSGTCRLKAASPSPPTPRNRPSTSSARPNIARRSSNTPTSATRPRPPWTLRTPS